jgi:hypothetical protein
MALGTTSAIGAIHQRQTTPARTEPGYTTAGLPSRPQHSLRSAVRSERFGFLNYLPDSFRGAIVKAGHDRDLASVEEAGPDPHLFEDQGRAPRQHAQHGRHAHSNLSSE